MSEDMVLSTTLRYKMFQWFITTINEVSKNSYKVNALKTLKIMLLFSLYHFQREPSKKQNNNYD